MSDGMSDLKIG